MAIIQDWLPPSKENYDRILLFASLQWIIGWYGMGKTSVNSRFNFPGRIAWIAMECQGFSTLVYIMNTLPAQQGITMLPWQNKVLAALFVIHYTYRAIIFPLIQPSMSPMHIFVWVAGSFFQVTNATCLGSWLAGYGPRTAEDWEKQLAPFPTLQFVAGIAVFYLGLAANYFHDEELREIRRREEARQAKLAREKGTPKGSIEKHYQIPQAGLFKYALYAHYLVEWVEWTGFWVACGWSCIPARMFVVNEITAMLPRAVRGKKWYIERFGEDKIKGRWAAIPGVI